MVTPQTWQPLEDELILSPVDISLTMGFTAMPFILKPGLAVASDRMPIFGRKRTPYLVRIWVMSGIEWAENRWLSFRWFGVAIAGWKHDPGGWHLCWCKLGAILCQLAGEPSARFVCQFQFSCQREDFELICIPQCKCSCWSGLRTSQTSHVRICETTKMCQIHLWICFFLIVSNCKITSESRHSFPWTPLGGAWCLPCCDELRRMVKRQTWQQVLEVAYWSWIYETLLLAF